jgi:hypothetical protein
MCFINVRGFPRSFFQASIRMDYMGIGARNSSAVTKGLVRIGKTQGGQQPGFQ